jgi:uncharacterized protein YajQ (UPF0234 family)
MKWPKKSNALSKISSLKSKVASKVMQSGLPSKSRDDLQGIIAVLRERADEFPLPLQFTNYR